MAWKWYEKKISRIENYTDTIKRFWIDLDGEEFNFTPGQFITMDLPIAERRLKRWRSYSIANQTNRENELEFIIVRLEHGAATTYLFDEVKVGDSIRFKGPDGGFVVPHQPNFDIVMICTGTGVAPFRPMIYDLLKNQKTERNIHLIFGTRTESGLLYRDEWEKLAEDYSNFRYSFALSRQEGFGHFGYIHDLYLEAYKNPREDVKFMLCGWTEMVDEAVANLVVKLKYAPRQVIYELYG